jgi:8-amino-3,8-dideoxy-alpha-D-manno-octulosonate transaminase
MPGFELIGKEELDSIKDIFKKNDLFYNGKRVKKFENKFAKYLGVKYAVAVSSGTAAIKTALIALGVTKGDEVITQSFTFIATVEAIMDIGAKPVIVNIDETLNMCPLELSKKITKKTKAIIPVHMLGVSVEVDKILRIAKKNKIPVIDDNCEALGAKWGKEKLGSQADMCTWSFDNGKTITTGEGGMITTNNKKYYNLCKEYKDHGHQNNPRYPRGLDTHRIYGFNYRITEIQAALGLVQLKKLNLIVKNNKANYKFIYDKISKIKKISFRKIPNKCKPLFDCLIFYLPNKNLANKFDKMLKSNKISTKNLPSAINWHFAKHWDHIFKKFGYTKKKLEKKFYKSSSFLERAIAIPISSKKDKKKINLIANKILNIANILKLN